MTRALIPGAFDRFGVARPFHRCTDACLDGCPLDRLSAYETELDCDVGLDGTRPFPAPPARPTSPRGRRRVGAVLVLALIAFGLVVLLAPRSVHSANLIVLVGPR